MPQTPYIQRARLVNNNGSDTGVVGEPLIVSGNITSASTVSGTVNIADVNFSGTQTDNLNVSVTSGNITVDSMPIVAVDINSATDSIMAYVNNATVAQMPTTTVTGNTLTVTQLAKDRTVTGTVTANAGTGTFTTQNLSSTTDSVRVYGNNLTVASMPAITVNVSSTDDSIKAYINNATIAQMPTTTVTGSALTVSQAAKDRTVTGTVTANAGTGTFTISNLNSANDNVHVFGNNLTIAEASSVSLASQTSPFTDDVNVSLDNEVIGVNANQSGSWDVTVSSGTMSVDNVDIYPSNWIGAYDTSNNLTQSIEVIGADTKTVSYAYDASNNLTNFATVIT